MQIIDKSLEELKPYAKNARKNKKAVKYVKNSIEQFGFKVPIVIDKNNIIVCGHTRYMAAKELEMDTVPCLIADDLTDAQIKAFRLADNKVGEQATWDFKLLSDEFKEVSNFNMSDFGFNFEDAGEEFEKHKNDTQKRVESILNMEKARFVGVGRYDIPIIHPIQPEDIGDIREWTRFDFTLPDKEPEGKAVHFFCDDYKFQRIWNNPDKYVDKLRQYAAVLTPDFSPYSDMPMAAQIFNHYRKHWVGAYLQANGVNVIPTIRGSMDKRSLEWFLDGEPRGGVVCVSSMWMQNDEKLDADSMESYNLMLETLKPSKIYVYGRKIDAFKGNVEYIPSFAQTMWGKK